jgi:hypothetical protein
MFIYYKIRLHYNTLQQHFIQDDKIETIRIRSSSCPCRPAYNRQSCSIAEAARTRCSMVMRLAGAAIAVALSGGFVSAAAAAPTSSVSRTPNQAARTATTAENRPRWMMH